MDALADGWGGLRGAAIAFHADRPSVGLGAVGLAGGLLGRLAGMPSVDLRAHDLAAPYDFSRFGAHEAHYSAAAGCRQSPRNSGGDGRLP